MNKSQQQQLLNQSSESGFTIIECLIAIIVVGILMTAIAPVIVFSVGTRVQARRVELATQAAKGYIDGVKSGAIAAPKAIAPAASPVAAKDALQGFAAPAVALSCATPVASGKERNYCSTDLSLYCVDGGDGGGCSSYKDLVIQTFRYNRASTDSRAGYNMGIRVYRADGFDGTAMRAGAGTRQRTYGAGLGDRKTPLMEMTTQIADVGVTHQDYCNSLGGCATPTPSPTPSPAAGV